MAVLSFSLTPEATGRVYEALVCLAKFGEAVSIEAKSEKARFHPTAWFTKYANARQLTITALNLSRTAYAAFALDSRSFFISYDFRGGGGGSSSSVKGGDRFTCQLLNKVNTSSSWVTIS